MYFRLIVAETEKFSFTLWITESVQIQSFCGHLDTQPFRLSSVPTEIDDLT